MAAQLTKTLDMGGNDLITNTVSIGAITGGQNTTGTLVSTIFSGAGAPAFAASVGDLYLNTTAASATTRAYICITAGSATTGAWTNFTMAA